MFFGDVPYLEEIALKEKQHRFSGSTYQQYQIYWVWLPFLSTFRKHLQNPVLQCIPSSNELNLSLWCWGPCGPRQKKAKKQKRKSPNHLHVAVYRTLCDANKQTKGTDINIWLHGQWSSARLIGFFILSGFKSGLSLALSPSLSLSLLAPQPMNDAPHSS